MQYIDSIKQNIKQFKSLIQFFFSSFYYWIFIPSENQLQQMLRFKKIWGLRFSSSSKITDTDKIMLFASYPVGYPMLKKLHQRFKNIHVVTHYTKPSSRVKNQVQTYCKSHNIQCFFPVKKEQSKQERQKEWNSFVDEVKKTQNKYKLGIACAYGYMLPQNVIKLFENGVVLAHPSLIPKYRGGSPIFHAIANGQRQSGASFMEVSANKFDQGNLLYQVKSPIGEEDTYQQVENQLSNLMSQQIFSVIQNLQKLRPGKNQSQMDTSSIPPHQLEAKIYKDKHLNVRMKAEQVYNWHRALIAPRVKYGEQQIIVFFQKSFLEDPDNSFKPGQLKLKGKNLYMKCADKFLKLSGWQQISKKPLAIHTFINRFIDKQKYNNQIIFE